MELREAINKANQILDEERISPTTKYTPRKTGDAALDALAIHAADGRLTRMRSRRPRKVLEDPTAFQLESANHMLLCALLSQVPEESRAAFFSAVLARVGLAPGCGQSSTDIYPGWNGLVSELPLVAEFSLRNGAKKEFLGVLAEANPLPGHVVLLRHMEELIALSFTVFTETEYQDLDQAVSFFKLTALKQAEPYRRPGPIQLTWPGLRPIYAGPMYGELLNSCNGIKEECRKARYFYLKGSLLEGTNLEINQDRRVVESYLHALGFTKPLIECLNAAQRLHLEGASPFDLKSSMGHLRSFLEQLHAEALPAVHADPKISLPKGWGDGLAYLRKKGVVSEAEEKFAAGLYTLISDEGVHPLIADKEYARLARNVVIEYALLFLRKLDKLGLKLHTENE